MKSYRGTPMTLGSAAAAQLRLFVWCRACDHKSEPDPAEQARLYGPETTVRQWRTRLVCERCGSKSVDMAVGFRANRLPRMMLIASLVAFSLSGCHGEHRQPITPEPSVTEIGRQPFIVYGVLRSGSWGFVQPKPDAPVWLGLSPVIWLLLGGGMVLLLFLDWETGDTLSITGRAELDFEPRQVHVTIERAIRTPHALPYRWILLERSRFNP